MEHDQERPIEKLLRGAAKDRLEQAGGSWEIHPASRRLLEGEVARRYPRGRETPGVWSWTRFLPRVAWAAGLCVVLALGFYALLPEKSQHQITSVGTEKSMELAAKPAAAPAPSEGKELRALQEKLTASQSAPTSTGGLSGVAKTSRRAFDVNEASVKSKSAEPETWGLQSDPASSDSLHFSRVAPTAKAEMDTTVAPHDKERADVAFSTVEPSTGTFRATLGHTAVVPEDTRLKDAQNEPQAGYAFGQFQEDENKAGIASKGVPALVPEPRLAGRAASSSGPATLSRSLQRPVAAANVPAQSTAAAKVATVAGNRILDNFALNQVGDEVVVVDNDGSVYRGSVKQDAGMVPSMTAPISPGYAGGAYFQAEQSKAPSTQSTALALSVEDSAARQALPAITNATGFLNFSVLGTNKTYGRKVEFAGKLVVANSNLVQNGIQNSFQNNSQNNIPANVFQNQVLGRARIEGMPALEVNAFQVQPLNNQASPGTLPKLPDNP